MEEHPVRREAARPPRRRVSAAAAAAAAAVAAAAEVGANVSLQDGEVIEVDEVMHPARDTQAAPDRLEAAARRMERRNSAPQVVHQRHMPREPLKFHIPRKTKEKRALFQDVSTESREYEDMKSILTSSYIDTSSAACFSYCKPRLVHSEPLEKEFVEKRKEMKADGRTEKELEESYCFLLAESVKLPLLCEKGLFVGQSWIGVLGNPTKGVYLSRYSDLLQNNGITPGSTGEIIIFKVMKGKVKSIYENMKNLLDPTPRFDSHISKNASKVTSLTSYRAFELTQQYFYEYSFDELRERPRQVCPYAVVSFQFIGKDSPLPSKPLAPIRLNSQSAEGSKERAQFTVWTGDLVKGDRVLFQISLRSFSPPVLPHRLPEKLEMGCLMRLDQLTRLLPSELLAYDLYSSSQEVVRSGHCCSLLEVMDRNRSTTSVTRLLHELEMKRVVLVTPLTDRGFLILISSVQMATPSERGENWKRSLQALFVFPESRDLSKSTVRCASHNASESLMSGGSVMQRLGRFIPALHHALVKARANPPAELSAGVERQAREYLVGLNDGKVRQYPMGEYESTQDEQEKTFPLPKHHRVNMESYLRSYLYGPALYLLSVARARQMVEAHCVPEDPREARPRRSSGGQREASSNAGDGQANTQRIQQLIDLVLTCKRNAENEVRREERGMKVPGRKRKMEQEMAERAIKYLKASQEPGRHGKIPVEGSPVPASPGSLASVIGSVGLKDVDLREDGSELAAKLLSLLTGLNQAARGAASQSLCEVQEEQKALCPFDKLATKLGLPTNCDIDLRRQDELEEQTAGSVSSLEGFSPSSHSGEMNHHRGGGGGGGGGERLGRRAGGYEEEGEEEEIPWILIPITGVCSPRYTQRDRNIPQDPRFQRLAAATSVTTTTRPPRKNPSPPPEPSPPPSPLRCPSPEPSPPHSPSQCPSPEPSPPASPSQCPSPEPSLPPSPSQCPSPESSPPPSPSQCPSPQPSSPPAPLRCPSPQLGLAAPPPSLCWSTEPNELGRFNKDHGGANEEQLAPAASRESAGGEEKPQRIKKENKEPSISASIQPSRTSPSPPHTELKMEEEVKEVQEELSEPEKETRLFEKVQEEEVEEVEEVETMHVVTSNTQQKGGAEELVDTSLFTPPVSSSHSSLDGIVNKNLGDFSSEMQLLLQEQSVHYSFPQSPHSTSHTETTAPPHTHPHTRISQFSQYVSFYNPCPPVQDYVSSLQDGIDSMLTEFEDGWTSQRPGTSRRPDTDAALASKVSDFVSSIRASNAQTDRDDEEDLCGELTAADVEASGSRGGDVWQPHAVSTQGPDDTNSRNLQTPHASLSGSVYKPPNTSVLILPPNSSPQSHWAPQQSLTVEINRTAAGQAADTSTNRTVVCTPAVEAGTQQPGFSSASKPSTEPSHPSEPASSPATETAPGPAPTDLSSLISQLPPEVFNSLVKIFKEVKRNSLQFYLHSTEPGDQLHEDVKDYLLKQGNTELSPVVFLNQDHSNNNNNRLLVVIKNKDIAGNIHKIPGLVSLKRQSSVVFVGIDTLDDIRNNSYNELFVSGGCIVSDELVLNPDIITPERLAALLVFLEQHSSLESVWRWKIHCKTHKKLKEQSRFRRDAANLLDVLSTFQKRQIVEFLPYHHCDMANHQSPDLDCLMELQARYTQYRHTVFLTGAYASEHHFEKFPAYASGGIIVAGIEEILHNFTKLVGYHDRKDRQPIMDDMLAPKDPGRRFSNSDSVSCSERSPSIFPEHIHPLSSRDQPQHLLQQSGSTPHTLSHLSDQLVPDGSCKEGVPPPSDTEYEVLRLAISQLRAERQAQLQQQLNSQAEFRGFLPSLAHTGSGHSTTTSAQGGPTESLMVTNDKKAVAATLELIHSALQQEPMEEERRADGAEGQKRGAGGGPPVRVVGSMGGNQAPSNSEPPSPSLNTAALTKPSTQIDSANGRRDTTDQQEEPVLLKAAKQSSSTTACPVEGDRSRDTQSGPEKPMGGEGAQPGNGTASGTKTISGDRNGPDHDSPRVSSTSCSQTEVDQLCSTSTEGRQPPGSTDDCASVSVEMELLSDLSESPSTPAQQRPAKWSKPRLQLFNHKCEKFSYTHLSNPLTWKHITYARPGWVPDHPPYLKLGNKYLELKANSTVVFTGMARPYNKGPKRVACGVTCYNHINGPWCEVQFQNGERICIIGVPPQRSTVYSAGANKQEIMPKRL